MFTNLHPMCRATVPFSPSRRAAPADSLPLSPLRRRRCGGRAQSRRRGRLRVVVAADCICPAQEQSSKLRSGEIKMRMRGPQNFGPITFSARPDNRSVSRRTLVVKTRLYLSCARTKNKIDVQIASAWYRAAQRNRAKNPFAGNLRMPSESLRPAYLSIVANDMMRRAFE